MIKRLVSSALCFAMVISTATSAFAAADDLQVVTMFGGADSHTPAFNARIAKFQKEKNITVENNSDQATEAWNASIITDFNTGNEPDVLYFHSGAIANPILDKVVSVATIRAAYPNYAKDTTAAALKSASATNGTSYAVPFSGFWEGLFINKDMFDKQKLAYPTNWDNFTKAIRGFSSNNIIPLTVPFADEPHYIIEHLILSAAGPAEHSVKFGTDISKVPASWYKGLDMLKTLADMGAFGNMKAATTKKNNAAVNEFNQQKAAMIVHGSWVGNNIDKAKRGNSVQVFAFPKMPDGKSSGNDVVGGFSGGYYITKKAWNDPVKRAQAVEFVNYMTSKDGVKAVLGAASAPAANIARSGGTLMSKSATAMSGNADSMNMPNNDAGILMPAAWTEVWTNAVNIANGKMTAAEVMAKAVPLNK